MSCCVSRSEKIDFTAAATLLASGAKVKASPSPMHARTIPQNACDDVSALVSISSSGLHHLPEAEGCVQRGLAHRHVRILRARDQLCGETQSGGAGGGGLTSAGRLQL
eukprot:755600-Hanusia_phi.AAC.2